MGGRGYFSDFFLLGVVLVLLFFIFGQWGGGVARVQNRRKKAAPCASAAVVASPHRELQLGCHSTLGEHFSPPQMFIIGEGGVLGGFLILGGWLPQTPAGPPPPNK